MPAESKAQARLFRAAEHGADFPMARKLRESASAETLHDFAASSDAGKPEHKHSTAAHSLRNLKSRIKHGK